MQKTSINRSTACRACRRRKVKCLRDGRSQNCRACVEKAIPCIPSGRNQRWIKSKSRASRPDPPNPCGQPGSPKPSDRYEDVACFTDLLWHTLSKADAQRHFVTFVQNRNKVIGVFHVAQSTNLDGFVIDHPMLYTAVVALQSEQADLIESVAERLHVHAWRNFRTPAVELLQALAVVVVYHSSLARHVAAKLLLSISVCWSVGRRLLRVGGDLGPEQMPAAYLRAWLSTFLVNEMYVNVVSCTKNPTGVTDLNNSIALTCPQYSMSFGLDIASLDRCQAALQCAEDVSATDLVLCSLVRLRLGVAPVTSPGWGRPLYLQADDSVLVQRFFPAFFEVLDNHSSRYQVDNATRSVVRHFRPGSDPNIGRLAEGRLLLAFSQLSVHMVLDLPEVFWPVLCEAVCTLYDCPNTLPRLIAEDKYTLCRSLLDMLDNVSERMHACPDSIIRVLQTWECPSNSPLSGGLISTNTTAGGDHGALRSHLW